MYISIHPKSPSEDLHTHMLHEQIQHGMVMHLWKGISNSLNRYQTDEVQCNYVLWNPSILIRHMYLVLEVHIQFHRLKVVCCSRHHSYWKLLYSSICMAQHPSQSVCFCLLQVPQGRLSLHQEALLAKSHFHCSNIADLTHCWHGKSCVYALHLICE